jgi:hypothetical protein
MLQTCGRIRRTEDVRAPQARANFRVERHRRVDRRLVVGRSCPLGGYQRRRPNADRDFRRELDRHPGTRGPGGVRCVPPLSTLAR